MRGQEEKGEEMSETNYERYFGTPEKAARTASQMCRAAAYCDRCPFEDKHRCPEGTLARALEWLESEADDGN